MTRAILAPRDDELGEAGRGAVAARLVDAFEVERRRIERDLHDGAQQRLVALTMKLGLARLDLPPGSPAAVQVAEAHEQARQALDELRELIRGRTPAGAHRPRPAGGGRRAGRPRAGAGATSTSRLPGRLPAAVEVTAYFVVARGAGQRRQAQRRDPGGRARPAGGDRLVLEVRDDGVGGADPAAGTGLAGLADRVAAVDGTDAAVQPARRADAACRAELPCG